MGMQPAELIPLLPQRAQSGAATNNELREDGGKELREDGSVELRE